MFDKGMSSTISTSKIKKITAIKKNRNENGSRAEFLGSNPHSKGDLFSRSLIIFFDKTDDKNIMIEEIIIVVKIIKDREIIISSVSNRPDGWKPTILSILKGFNFLLISKLKYIGIIKLRQQNVNTKQLLQIRNDGY